MSWFAGSLSSSFKRSQEQQEDLIKRLHFLIWPRTNFEGFKKLINAHHSLITSRYGRNNDTLLHRWRNGNVTEDFHSKLNIQTYSQSFSFARAARHGRTQFVDFLLGLGSGVPLDAQNACGRTALHLAAHTLRADVVHRLLEAGANVDVADAAGDGAMHLACQAGSLGILKILLAEAVCEEPGCAGGRGNSLLHYAARFGHLDLMTFLIDEVGHEVDARNHKGETPLHLASGVHKPCTT